MRRAGSGDGRWMKSEHVGRSNGNWIRVVSVARVEGGVEGPSPTPAPRQAPRSLGNPPAPSLYLNLKSRMSAVRFRP